MTDQLPATHTLIKQARAGDAQAVESLLRRYREYVRLLVRCRASGRLQARVDSSDFVQETLLRAAQNIQQFQGTCEQEWCAWLARIADHEVIHQRRHHLGAAKRAAGREQMVAAEPADVSNGGSRLERWFTKAQTSPSLAAMRKERSLLLADALARLPEDYREVLILRHLEGLEFAEVGQRMNRSAGAVRILWTRGLKKLRDELQKGPGVDQGGPPMPDPGNHDQSTTEQEVAEILDGYRQELQGGDDPDPEDCLIAHPGLASELADCLHGFAAMEELREVLRAVDPPLPFAPHSLGDFHLVREIGRGGMGVVYEAIHTNLKRRVALKMIKAGALADGQDVEMFRKEALAAASMQHPNIVQLYEVGEHGGLPYLVLEYVDGGSLDAKLVGTPIDPYQAAQLLMTLAQAMHYAHERGIVHRDLKPANVLLQIPECRTPIEKPAAEHSSESAILNLQTAVPKITDFGLAKQLHADAGQTQSGTIKGTPSYMAPEQASGRPISSAADVYALGAILYETLTGRPPFRAATALDTLMQVTSLEPVPPARLQPKVPRDLETICLKCLRKEPHRRYGSAQDLADELGRFLRHEPILARPVGVSGRVWRWCRRNPVVAALLGVAAALTALIVVLVVLNFANRSVRREQILRSNVFAANHLANTILVELWKLAEAVDQTASDERLQELLRVNDRRAMQNYFVEKHAKITGMDGKPAFHTWHVVNRKGILLADAPPPEKDVFGVDFKGRDYFIGALRHQGDTGRARIHLSRAYQSLNDKLFKITLSAVVYDGPDSKSPVLGVVSATLPTNATLGSLQLDDSERTAVLVGRLDTNPHDQEPPVTDPPPAYLVLVHPAYGELPEYGQGKKAVSIPAELLRLVPKRRPDDKDEFVPKPRSVVDAAEAFHNAYEDPLGKVHPAKYSGRWLAGFAPVGNFEMVVIVQQRREEFWPASYWLFLGGMTLLAAGLVATALWSLRRRRGPATEPSRQQAPTVSATAAPPNL